MSTKMDFSEMITAEDILLASQEDGFMDGVAQPDSGAFRASHDGVYFLLGNSCLLKISSKPTKYS